MNVPTARDAALDVARRCADVPDARHRATSSADRKPICRMKRSWKPSLAARRSGLACRLAG